MVGQDQFRSIKIQVYTSVKTNIIVFKEHKISVALSESLYWKQAYFQFFDGTSIERAMAPPSDGSGSIKNHSNIRSDIRKHWHYGH